MALDVLPSAVLQIQCSQVNAADFHTAVSMTPAGNAAHISMLYTEGFVAVCAQHTLLTYLWLLPWR